MLNLYRCLLYLYPRFYRHQFSREMIAVFGELQDTGRGERFSRRIWFFAREVAGLLSGALRQQMVAVFGPQAWDSLRRFKMRSDFRFPRSTVFLMLVILAGVILSIREAKDIVTTYGGQRGISVWSAWPGFTAMLFATVAAAAVIGWALLFALKRSGMHRLSNVQGWPEK